MQTPLTTSSIRKSSLIFWGSFLFKSQQRERFCDAPTRSRMILQREQGEQREGPRLLQEQRSAPAAGTLNGDCWVFPNLCFLYWVCCCCVTLKRYQQVRSELWKEAITNLIKCKILYTTDSVYFQKLEHALFSYSPTLFFSFFFALLT